jgi:ribose transport system ATP-binding protein
MIDVACITGKTYTAGTDIDHSLHGSPEFSMSTDAVLVMQGIRKSFPGVLALDDVQFELRRGEVHVLLGENGAGKSTLVKILGGVVRKDAGRILLRGCDVDIRNPHYAQQLGIALIHQELHLVARLTAGENIFLGREPQRLPGVLNQPELFRRSQKALADLRADVDVHTQVKHLSVARQQMVEIAKAISLEATVLIMDEPTSALSEVEITELFATMGRLKERGVSIIYITHRMEDIFRIGDRVTVLMDGKYIGTYDTRDVTRSQLVRLMVNREIKEQYPKERNQRGEEIMCVEHLCRKGVLNDVSFSLHRGEVLGIAGLLGSGRTELARALFGADRIDSGEIRLKGISYTRLSPRRAIRLGMGFLAEDRKADGLFMLLSVKDNIILAALDRLSRLGIVSRNREFDAARRQVDDLRVKTPSIEKRVLHLSGGNQQKVLLGRWLCTRAEIFIFDEPTRGIDVGAKVEIYRLINRLTADGAAVIMISSELPEILGMSDRILVLRKGEIAAELTAEGATQESILLYAVGK